jgi:hypothetical protein
MKRIVLALASVLFTFSAAAKDKNEIKGDYFHGFKRAIAFGSVILENGGEDVNTWKALDAFSWCDDLPEPLPLPLPIPKPKSAKDQPNECSWTVEVTKTYEFVECPDGSYYVSRSGVGVDVTSPTEGSVFAWAEMYLCEDGPIPGGDQPNRPLDQQRIRRTQL